MGHVFSTFRLVHHTRNDVILNRLASIPMRKGIFCCLADGSDERERERLRNFESTLSNVIGENLDPLNVPIGSPVPSDVILHRSSKIPMRKGIK